MILVVYRKSDNKSCGNSGTGPVIDPDHEIANAILNFGGQPEDYGVIETETLPRNFRVESGQLIDLPEPEPKPQPPGPDEELATAIAAATNLEELKAALLGQGWQVRAAGKRV